MNKHSRLYQELQEHEEYREFIRWHKVMGIGAMIGLGLGLIIHLIN